MNFLKAFLTSIFFAFSLNTNAALTWIYNVTLVKAGYYYDGSVDVWTVSWEDNISTGCTHGDNLKKASWAGTGGVWDVGAARLTPALTAVTAGMKADIMVEPNVCHPSRGVELQGVIIHR